MNISFDGVAKGTNINDIKVDPRLRVRVNTGLPFMNFCLSGDSDLQGLLPGGVYLFTGTAGSGKSTLALQLLDSLSGMGHTAMLNGCEESPAQVKMTYERLRLKNGFILGNDVFTNRPDGLQGRMDKKKEAESIKQTLLEHMDHVFAKHVKANKRRGKADKKHMCLIVDSLQTMNDGFHGFKSNKNATPIRVLEQLTQFAKDNYATVIVIGHVGKSGEFKGDNTLIHMVDGHLHLYVDLDPKSDTEGCRILECRKNRFGPSGIAVVLDIGKNGLREHKTREGNSIKGMRV